MDNRILFGIMCIIFNSYGIPCFMQGHVKEGVLRIEFYQEDSIEKAVKILTERGYTTHLTK